MTILLLLALAVIVALSFLMGSTYRDRARRRENRRQAAVQRSLNDWQRSLNDWQRSLNERLGPLPELCPHCHLMLSGPGLYTMVVAGEDDD
jgi:hypothetical protein